MELLCAILTGVFFWLFIYHWSSFARRTRFQQAGAPLLEVVLPYRARMLNFAAMLIPCLMLLSLLGVFYVISLRNPLLSVAPFFVMIELYVAALVLTLLSAIETVSRKRSFTIHENGIASHIFLITWERIRFCRWARSKKRLYVRSRRNTILLRTSVGEYEAVTATLGRFVEVRDCAGGVIVAGPHKYVQTTIVDSFKEWIKRRLHVQFDLLTLLLLVLLCASASSWYGIIHRRSRAQDAAIEKLSRLNPQAIGFLEVTYLGFPDEKNRPQDEDLMYLKPLSSLQTLFLDMDPVTDRGLVYLESLSHLRYLSLMKTDITDRGLEHLTKLTQLRVLTLLQDNITDDGIVYLKQMKNLRELYIQGTKITPKGVEELQKALPDTKIEFSSPSPPAAAETDNTDDED
jgi:hypothetical protein